MRKLLALGAIVVGGMIAARRLLYDRRTGATIKQRMMARMMVGLPPDSPPKLVMSILPRLRQQNDEIIALLREQNELLRQGRTESVTRSRESLG